MTYKEIKDHVEKQLKKDSDFLVKADLVFAVENIDCLDSEPILEDLCLFVQRRYEAYVKKGGEADIYDFCSAVGMNLSHHFEEPEFKHLRKLNWKEVADDADHYLQ